MHRSNCTDAHAHGCWAAKHVVSSACDPKPCLQGFCRSGGHLQLSSCQRQQSLPLRKRVSQGGAPVLHHPPERPLCPQQRHPAPLVRLCQGLLRLCTGIAHFVPPRKPATSMPTEETCSFRALQRQNIGVPWSLPYKVWVSTVTVLLAVLPTASHPLATPSLTSSTEHTPSGTGTATRYTLLIELDLGLVCTWPS